MANASGYSGNSRAVTSLTRLSVHWADRIVATSVSNGLEKFNSGRACG